MACICGHAPEDHKDDCGVCEIEGCLCCGYEEEADGDDEAQEVL
jgi:hypothetical protein